jgi:uncharacterized protein with von Willebrand factor type A (vWA) domain
MHKYGEDYKVVVVGDATMSPYEILQPGGSVEYSNEEAGAVWLQRMLDTWPRAVWLNPEPERLWDYRHSIELIRTIFNSRMFPLTLAGLPARSSRCSARAPVPSRCRPPPSASAAPVATSSRKAPAPRRAPISASATAAPS